jgi:hypothetical protein
MSCRLNCGKPSLSDGLIIGDRTIKFQTVSAAEAIEKFCEPEYDEFDQPIPPKTIEEAQAALQFLVEHEMIVIRL